MKAINLTNKEASVLEAILEAVNNAMTMDKVLTEQTQQQIFSDNGDFKLALTYFEMCELATLNLKVSG